MRIAFSGSACVGKSTLVKGFLRRWPNYVTLAKTYRDIIQENDLPHSSSTTEETQLMILDWMMKTMKHFPKESKIVYDRCPLDNLVYTLQGNINGQISDVVTASTISLVRESMKDLDIIFWIPRNQEIKVVDDQMRDTKEEFIAQTESIFEDLYDHYREEYDSDIFFPKEDCPAIIRLESATFDDRMWEISQYLDPSGELIEGSSVLSEENLNLMEALLKDQEKAKLDDAELEAKMQKILSNLK